MDNSMFFMWERTEVGLRRQQLTIKQFHVQLVHILTQIVRMDMDMVHHITTVINQDIVHTGVVIQYMINIKPYKKWQKSNKK